MASYSREPNIETFGTALLTSGDLDPLYIALVNAKLERDQLRRWLFAYWCCYHAGVSSVISERISSDYWDAMHAMAANESPSPLGGRWARGRERRHFRGEKAVTAVGTYRSVWPEVEKLVAWIEGWGPGFYGVRSAVETLPLFGPWIAFKVADMLERVLSVPMDFTDADVMMFSSPYLAALDHYRANASDLGPVTSNNAAVKLVTDRLLDFFSKLPAPPQNDRPINLQEVETILCKWRSHLKGMYPLGIDTQELRHALTEWAPVSETATILLQAAPAYAPPKHAD